MGGDYLKYQPLVAGRGCSLADISEKKTISDEKLCAVSL